MTQKMQARVRYYYCACIFSATALLKAVQETVNLELRKIGNSSRRIKKSSLNCQAGMGGNRLDVRRAASIVAGRLLGKSYFQQDTKAGSITSKLDQFIDLLSI